MTETTLHNRVMGDDQFPSLTMIKIISTVFDHILYNTNVHVVSRNSKFWIQLFDVCGEILHFLEMFFIYKIKKEVLKINSKRFQVFSFLILC